MNLRDELYSLNACTNGTVRFTEIELTFKADTNSYLAVITARIPAPHSSGNIVVSFKGTNSSQQEAINEAYAKCYKYVEELKS